MNGHLGQHKDWIEQTEVFEYLERPQFTVPGEDKTMRCRHTAAKI